MAKRHRHNSILGDENKKCEAFFKPLNAHAKGVGRAYCFKATRTASPWALN